jgi:energy-coupling factor transporter ATP-binding protein EcfA2
MLVKLRNGRLNYFILRENDEITTSVELFFMAGKSNYGKVTAAIFPNASGSVSIDSNRKVGNVEPSLDIYSQAEQCLETTNKTYLTAVLDEAYTLRHASSLLKSSQIVVDSVVEHPMYSSENMFRMIANVLFQIAEHFLVQGSVDDEVILRILNTHRPFSLA